MWKKIVVFCMTSFGATYALAQPQDFEKLDAEYAVTTKDIVDPAPDAKPDRLVFSITGKSAKKIFDSMLVPARYASCDGIKDNSIPPTKSAGGLECTGDGKHDYVCTFGVMLDSGKTVRGYICD